MLSTKQIERAKKYRETYPREGEGNGAPCPSGQRRCNIPIELPPVSEKLQESPES